LDVTEAHRLRRRALRDSSPQSTIELCRLLQRQGRVKASRETARAGLMRFPHSAELKEILHATWKRTEGRKLKDLEDRLRREPTVDSHVALVEYYLGFNELDKALDAASRLIQSHPQDARGFIVHGRVLIARFHRDH